MLRWPGLALVAEALASAQLKKSGRGDAFGRSTIARHSSQTALDARNSQALDAPLEIMVETSSQRAERLPICLHDHFLRELGLSPYMAPDA